MIFLYLYEEKNRIVFLFSIYISFSRFLDKQNRTYFGLLFRSNLYFILALLLHVPAVYEPADE